MARLDAPSAALARRTVAWRCPSALSGLAGAHCAGQLDDEHVEPPVPAGLTELTPAQQALAEFLALDVDLLAAAASASSELGQSPPLTTIAGWLLSQRTPCRPACACCWKRRAPEAERSVRQRFRAWQAAQRPEQAPPRRRQVAEIQHIAQQIRPAAAAG